MCLWKVSSILSYIFGDGTKIGVVESIDLTFGGAGNQVMSISGTSYATWIDYKQWPKIGSRVTHQPYWTHDGRGNKLLATRIIGPANDEQVRPD